jgi:hypothetical protein
LQVDNIVDAQEWLVNANPTGLNKIEFSFFFETCLLSV